MTVRATVNPPRPENVGSWFTRMTARGGGLAKPARFLISINPPRFPRRDLLQYPEEFNRLKDLTFQCEATELPGRSISTSDVQIAGPTFKLPYDTAYQDITFTFICTNDMYERKLFDDWINYINNKDNFTFTYREEYATSIGIFQYDEGGDGSMLPSVTYGVQLVDAYPIAINQMNLAWGEDNFHRLGITFAYTYYQTLGGFQAPVPLPFNSATIQGALSSVGNLAVGTVNGFISNQIGGAFTGIGNFLGSFFS